MQRGEHQVAGLGGGERQRGRLGVADLAHQDHVRVLAQRRAQAAVEGGRVQAHLALRHQALLVPHHVLDRVLERDDAQVLGAVELGQQRGDGRALARAGDARHHDQALGQLEDAVQHVLVRETQRVHGRHRARQAADDAGQAVAVVEGVDAEVHAALLLDVEGRVHVLRVLALELLDLVRAQQRVDQRRQREVAEVVDAERRLEAVDRLAAVELHEPGVVHEDVDAPPAGQHALDRAPDLLRRGHVGLRPEDLAAIGRHRGHDPVDAGAVQVEGRHPGALAREEHRDRPPVADPLTHRTCAEDERNLVLQSVGHRR